MTDIDDLIEELKQKRDELRVQINLASREIKDEWEDLEEKMDDFADKAKELSAEAGLYGILIEPRCSYVQGRALLAINPPLGVVQSLQDPLVRLDVLRAPAFNVQGDELRDLGVPFVRCLHRDTFLASGLGSYRRPNPRVLAIEAEPWSHRR